MAPRLLVSESFPARLESATQARRFAEQTLVTWGCPELADTALLLVSELVVNAVSHASSTATVHLTLADGVLRVAVDDSSSVVPAPQVASPDDANGRGLMIVAALADRWGVESTATGKTVWFELAPPPPGRS